MSSIPIRERKAKFQRLIVEFFEAVKSASKEPSGLDQLEGDLSTLLTIDTEIQERLKTSSAEERPLNARLEHDFNYVWVGLRQFNEPHLKRSSINTLEETLSSLKGLQRSFTGRFNPIPPLGNVICVLKGLDCR